MPAQPEHDGDGAEHQRDDDRPQHRPGAGIAGGGGERVLGRGGEAGALAVLLGEGLDRADGVDGFLGCSRDIGHAVLGGAGQAADAPADHHDRDHHQRHHDQDEAGEPGVGHHQEGEAAHDQEHVAQRLGDAGADHGLDDAGVGGQARQHLARAGHLEEAGRQMEDVAVDVAPQVGDDALAQPGDQIGAQVGRDRQGHDDDADSLDRVVERAGVAFGKAAVDQIAQADAQGEHGGGGQDEGERARR